MYLEKELTSANHRINSLEDKLTQRSMELEVGYLNPIITDQNIVENQRIPSRPTPQRPTDDRKASGRL